MARNVLIVDDDPAIRKVLSTTLELEGYDIQVAVDGEEALVRVGELVPDLMILDVMMPKLNGFDLLERLRAEEPTSNIPVILLTARSSQEDQWEGWRRGVDYYMTKPFDVEDLLRFIEYVFSGDAGSDMPTD